VLVCAGAFDNIALYAAAIAHSLGAEHIDVVGIDDPRVERVGARVLAADEVEPGAYPVTVDASMDPALLALALRATAPAGTCTASTMYLGEPTPVPLMEMFAACVTFVTGQPDVRGTLDGVLSLLARDADAVAPVLDEVLPWDDAPAAWRAGSGKRVISRA
jgi:threonine dehydrogenase-like Zn-dependent dehydrogenase